MWRYLLIVALVAIVGLIYIIGFCQHSVPTISERPVGLSYLPLGDSYTIGESVSEKERWPNQLVEKLKADTVQLNIVSNPSVTGYTTQDLIDRELPLVAELKPDFVTVLIGVNDYVQGVDERAFSEHLNYILDTLQDKLAKPKQIVLVTIPDYGKTPTGSRYGDPTASEAAIASFNEIIKGAAAARALPVADIFSVSQKVSTDKSLVAKDGLHPSGAQYTLWTEVIYKTIVQSHLFKQ